MDIRPIIEDLEYLKSVYGDCPAEEALDVLKVDALRRIAKALESNANQTQAKSNQMQIKGNITWSEFFAAFNAISQGYHACPSSRGGAAVVDKEGHLKANLDPKDSGWSFYASAWSYDQFALMAGLAKTPPELRGGIDDE